MLRVTSRIAKQSVNQIQPRRFAHGHGVHYGPAEPAGAYFKWIAVIGGFVGLLTYDRFYSDRAITKLITPETDTAAIERQREKFADRQIQEQDRNIESLFPRQRTTHSTNFSPSPVPGGSHREKHTNNVLDTETLGERRPRA